MATTAFPVRQTSDGVGCTDVTLRKILGALYPDKGVVAGLSVSGQNGTSYKVSEGVAVCSKGAADGTTLAYFEGGSVDVSANSSSNPRIDVVWLTAHDVTQGDSDNLVTLGVTQGTAAATPAKPAIPSYATELGAMQVPAGATTTAKATAYGSVGQAVPYGASLGLIEEIVQTHNSNWGSSGVTQGMASRSFAVSTPRTLQLNVTVTAGANGGTYADGDGSLYSLIKLDGATVDNRELRLRAAGNAVSQFYQVTCEVSAGSHELSWSMTPNACSSIRMYYSKGGWAGQQIQIVDLGTVD